MKLQIRNLSKKYGSNTALAGLDLDIESGNVFGLVGPNGAGKSTLMRILATLLKPSGGEVLWEGVSIFKEPDALRRVLGYLPQDVAVYPNLSATEFLSYMAALKGIHGKDAKKQIENLLGMFHLSEYGNRRLSDYSGGMKQRVGISAALLGNPQIIIVDEPSVGLDPEERIGLRNMLCDLSKERIVLLSTHIISDIESTATQLAAIRKGHLLFQGTPSELTAQFGGSLEQAYVSLMHEEVSL